MVQRINTIKNYVPKSMPTKLSQLKLFMMMTKFTEIMRLLWRDKMVKEIATLTKIDNKKRQASKRLTAQPAISIAHKPTQNN